MVLGCGKSYRFLRCSVSFGNVATKASQLELCLLQEVLTLTLFACYAGQPLKTSLICLGTAPRLKNSGIVSRPLLILLISMGAISWSGIAKIVALLFALPYKILIGKLFSPLESGIFGCI
ncbi:hypothetical protein CMV_011825 [Castanea mollissima]|uniref:Uncharacterized protein n=1 Tax=Castanea mollissima TaxID=60419 RepID=A0A8J4R2J0_9ROSI|nr:hypothetical protein CMV_011825 [Castanea mollissima]